MSDEPDEAPAPDRLDPQLRRYLTHMERRLSEEAKRLVDRRVQHLEREVARLKKAGRKHA